MKKGFSLVELIVSLVIISSVIIIAMKLISATTDYYTTSKKETVINSISSKLYNIINSNPFLTLSSYTPRGIFVRDFTTLNVGGTLDEFADDYNIAYINYEKVINNPDDADNILSSFKNFDFFHGDEVKQKKQIELMQINKQELLNLGNMPSLFMIQRYSNYQGIKYPYKIFSIVSMDSFLRAKFKNYFKAHSTTNNIKLLNLFFQVTDNGVVLNKIDLTNEDNIDILEDLLGTNYQKLYLKHRNIFISIISNKDGILKKIEYTYKKIEEIKTTLANFATIQARNNAYDATNGDNLNKDYFITCTGEGCNLNNDTEYTSVDKTKTLKPNLEDDAKINIDIEENDLSNGFFICNNYTTEADNSYACDDTAPMVIQECSADTTETNPMGQTHFLVSINKPTANCLLNKAGRNLLSYNNFVNPFGFNTYFSNTYLFYIRNEVTDLLHNDTSDDTITDTNNNVVFSILNNIPIEDKSNNPPYNAYIITLFPWFAGGIENDEDYKVDMYNTGNKSKGFGVYYTIVTATLF